MKNLYANESTSFRTMRKRSSLTWIGDVTPAFTSLDIGNKSHGDAVLHRDLFQWSRIRLYLTNPIFGQFSFVMFFSIAMSAMTKPVAAITLRSVVTKIFDSIIRGYYHCCGIRKVPLAFRQETPMLSCAELCTVALNTVLGKRDVPVSIFVRERFQYPSDSPASDQRPDSAIVTDHVKTFIVGNIFPNFLIHTMIHRISLWGLSSHV